MRAILNIILLTLISCHSFGGTSDSIKSKDTAPLSLCDIYGFIGIGGNLGQKIPVLRYPYGYSGESYYNISERPGVSFGLGFIVKLASIKRFSIQTGIEFERLSYEGTVHKTITTYPFIYPPPPPAVSYIPRKYTYNEYFLHFPLTVAYRLTSTKDMYMAIKLGGTPSLHFKEDMNSIPGYNTPRQLMIFGQTSIPFYKVISESLVFYLEPAFKCQLLPIHPNGRIFYSATVKLGLGIW